LQIQFSPFPESFLRSFQIIKNEQQQQQQQLYQQQNHTHTYVYTRQTYNMDSMTYNDFGFTAISTPNKRKQMEERDDDIVVTPSSSYDSSSDSDDNTRDTDSFVSTPCPAAFESPWKRRKVSLAVYGHHSALSPPLMPRLKYRSLSLSSENDDDEQSRPHAFAARGRPVLDLFGDSNSYEQPENDLSFLAFPTSPSNISAMSHDEKIPSFDLSPRTTLKPRFPEFFRRPLVVEKEPQPLRRNLPPSLRMRTTTPNHYKFGKKQLIEELSLPALAEVTLRETGQVRRSSLPAAA
jgi:hypothetical protein